ncbi:MAG TPA: hypothetical protein VGR81_05035 [Candidatus Acidoferrales bacterium]|nr:hypothetical protein [Candidatus Acidoferrales bacterium]
MRKAALLFGIFYFAALVSAVRPAAADSQSDHEWSKTWTVSASTEFHLIADRGSVHVTQGPANSVRAVVTTEGWRIDSSEVSISDSQDSQRLDLRVRTPNEDHSLFHWHTDRVQINLQVPTGSHLDLETGFGDFFADPLEAELRVSTGFGGIHLAGYQGSLHADTGFGDMTVEGHFNALVLKTGFGHIHARADSGSRISDDWRLSSGFGDVSLGLPDGLNAYLDAHTGMGRVSSDFPIAITRSVEHSSLRGRIGSGGPDITIETGFGSVRLDHT